MFLVTAFGKHSFRDVERLYVRLVLGESTTGEELCKFQVRAQGEVTAALMASLYLEDGKWKFRAIGEVHD